MSSAGRRVLEDQHPQVARGSLFAATEERAGDRAEAENMLGACTVRLGRVAEGRALLESGAAELERVLGADHAITRSARARARVFAR